MSQWRAKKHPRVLHAVEIAWRVVGRHSLVSGSAVSEFGRHVCNSSSHCHQPPHSFVLVYRIPNSSYSLSVYTSITMPVQDRTNEFRACVESIRTRSSFPSRGSDAKQRLLQAHGKSGGKSDFSRMASGIGKDISSTNLKLGKLAQRESGSSVITMCCIY